MNMKINKKIVIGAIAVLAAAGFAFDALRPKAPAYKIEKAALGDITQEVVETGSIKKGEALNLNFKTAGAIAKVNVVKGDLVEVGQILAGQDDRQSQVQLAQARANLELYRLQLEKLNTGATIEDLEISQSQAQAARISLEGAQKSLADAKNNADQKLNSAYKSAADALSSAYTKSYAAFNFLDLLQRTYFSPQDDDSIAVWENVQKMNLAVGRIRQNRDAALANGKDGGLDPVFAAAKSSLAEFEAGLRFARAMSEKVPWREKVAQTDKDTLDAHIGYVVAAGAAFNSTVEAVALQIAANDLAVNSAQAAVDAARAALKTAGGQLAKTAAPARAEDEGILQAQIKQAAAQIELLELQINDAKLIAPVAGQIVEINVKVGETASILTGKAAIVLLPADPYAVEVDIYEEEAIKVKLGDVAKITVAALPDEEFLGKVAFLDPAGKLVNGVVYYPVKISFDAPPENLKPDMTADVEIITAKKQNVLLVSETALQKNPEGGWFARILENGAPREVAVQIGIRAKGQTEITSGLSEGDQIVIP